jgi:hypothetical protein
MISRQDRISIKYLKNTPNYHLFFIPSHSENGEVAQVVRAQDS